MKLVGEVINKVNPGKCDTTVDHQKRSAYVIWHRLFTLDALPDATLPIYPGLGSAIRSALTCESPVAGEHTGVWCLAQGHFNTLDNQG